MVEIDLISVWGSELTWFRCRDRNWLGFAWGSKITCFRLDQKLLSFCIGGHRNWLVFRMRIGIDLTSVLGLKWTWLSYWGSEFSWFYCGGRNWLFCVGVEIDLVFCVRAENDLCYCGDRLTWLFCGGWNRLGSSMRAGNHLVLCVHQNWLVFCVSGRNQLDFSVGIRIDLVFVLQWKMTCF